MNDMHKPSAENVIQAALMLAICLCACVFLLRRLYFTIAFYKEVKGKPEKSLTMTRARVKTSLIRRHRFYASSAAIRYERDGREAKARMVCACEKELRSGDEIDVLLDGTGKYFALDLRHLKNALLTWSVLGALSIFPACGAGVLFVLALTGRF